MKGIIILIVIGIALSVSWQAGRMYGNYEQHTVDVRAVKQAMNELQLDGTYDYIKSSDQEMEFIKAAISRGIDPFADCEHEKYMEFIRGNYLGLYMGIDFNQIPLRTSPMNDD